MHIETVKVMPWSKDQGDHVVINKADFNPEKHRLLDAEGDDGAPDGAKKATVAELRAVLEQKGIQIPDGAKKADLQALVDSLGG